MRSIYRIKKLALNTSCQARAVPVRQLSTTSIWSRDVLNKPEIDLSDLRRFEASTSTSTTSRWSDAGVREGESSQQSSSTSGSSSFFTPFRPSSFPVPPASQVDLGNLHVLYPLLYRQAHLRDEEFCAQVWRQYHHLAPSTRRALHPKIMQMILRAVIPSRASRTDAKRKAKDPVRSIEAYSGKMERRLQVIIADMLRSTWVDDVSKKAAMIPNHSDYQYAMSTLAHLGGTEACEAIYRELKESGHGAAEDGESLLPYRLEALKVWMTGRVKYSSWTRTRPGALTPSDPTKRSNMRYRPEKEIKDPSTHAITVLWSILGELSQTRSTPVSDDEDLFHELVLALRQILRFLPDDEKTVADTVRKILKQALEKGYGIDFKFLRQDPALQEIALTSEIVDSVVYLMGSQGDVWRMVAMYESLTGEVSSSSSAELINAAVVGEADDIGETLSGALEAEAASGQNLDWLGREKISNAPAPAPAEEATRVFRRDAPPHLPQAIPSSNSPRRFDDYLAAVPGLNASPNVSALTDSPEDISLPAQADTLVSEVSPLVTTNTITTMMEAIKRSDNIDLAVHLLRTSLREAAQSRQIWLGELVNSTSRTTSEVQTEDPAVLQASSNIAEPETATAAATEPSENSAATETPSIAKITLPQRHLLVSAQWFEAAHLLARKGSEAIWAATEIRQLMESEIKSLAKEHLILTGSSIDDPIGDIDPSASIYAITMLNRPKRPFDPTRHLQYLRKTHRELTRMATVSVEQQERRRAITRAKNARRAERDAEVAKAEREKVEAKQALRKRRDEIQEAPLALA